ncbi:MAG: hypothetical protein SEPTF4163_004726 [Sporothrix epigloea]
MARTAVRIPDSEAVLGRQAWRRFLEAQPVHGETLSSFFERLDELAVEILNTCDPENNCSFDHLLIWHVLDLLEAALPNWEDEFQINQSMSFSLGSAYWQTQRSWVDFMTVMTLYAPSIEFYETTATNAEKARPLSENTTTLIADGGKSSASESRRDNRKKDSEGEASLNTAHGFANDVDNEVKNPDERNVVIIDGEERYVIPGYESRKTPRHNLKSAPRSVIERFFRSKFPGRPKCIDCKCQHPEEGYMLCSHCHFCHMGGDDECYYQHPQLRGTRPAKDKYRIERRSSETDSCLEEELGADESLTTPDLDTDSFWRNLWKQMESKQQDGVEMNPKPASASNNNVPTPLGPGQASASRAETKSFFELATSMEKLSVFETGQSAHMTSDGTARLNLPSGTPRTPSKSPSLIFNSPQNPFAAYQGGAMNFLPSQAVTEPVESESLFGRAAANSEGGAKLTESNLSRLPHGKNHNLHASMSSLTTSSSGASLAKFRLRVKAEMEKATEKETAEEAASLVAHDGARSSVEKIEDILTEAIGRLTVTQPRLASFEELVNGGLVQNGQQEISTSSSTEPATQAQLFEEPKVPNKRGKRGGRRNKARVERAGEQASHYYTL